MPWGAPHRVLRVPSLPGPLSSPPPRPRRGPLSSPPPLRGLHPRRLRPPSVARGAERERGDSGPPRATAAPPAAAAASSGRRRARAGQTGGRRSARPSEPASEPASAVPTRRAGGSRPGRREGRCLGEARRCAEPMRAPRGRGFAGTRPAPGPCVRARPAPASGRAPNLGYDGRAGTRRQRLQHEPRGPYLLWWGRRAAFSRLFSHSSSRESRFPGTTRLPLPEGKFGPDLYLASSGRLGELGTNSPPPPSGCEITGCSLPTLLYVR